MMLKSGWGATLAKYARHGYKVGICDLTKAELSSNGTIAIRMEEAERAKEILGIDCPYFTRLWRPKVKKGTG